MTRQRVTRPTVRWLHGLLASVLVIAAISVVLELLKPWVTPPPMVPYVLAIYPIAIVWGVRLAVVTAVLSSGAYYYLFARPDGSFDAADTRPLFGLGVFLITAIVAGELTARLQRATVQAQEQATLRRVATLAARGAPPSEVFPAAAEELGKELNARVTGVLQYLDDGCVTVVGGWSALGKGLTVGARLSVLGRDIAASVRESGRPTKMDRLEGPAGSLASALRDLGVTAGAGSPVIVDERPWGVVLVAFPDAGEMPAGVEHRIPEFAELVGTVVSNTRARTDLRRIADEQAALRRVATRVARAAPPDEVFGTVAEEAGRLLDVSQAMLCRCQPGGAVVVAAAWSSAGAAFPVGAQLSLDGENMISLVAKTGRPARMTDNDARGPAAEAFREFGIRAGVGVPISVEHRLWGVMIVASEHEEALPVAAENRLADFTELVAVAIANAEAQAEVSASRARILAAADQTRRQIERDLHDGAQQRLVSLGLQLRTLRAAIPSELAGVGARLDGVLAELTSAQQELREYARGIHPALLGRGGLAPALSGLARRSTVNVELDVRTAGRLPEPIEVTVYYLVSEALTNAAKHANASAITVVVEANDNVLHVLVSDDGIGGADLNRGTGLLGLKDRVEATGGRISLDSPRDAGTTLRADLPLTNADRVPAN